jgi:hypothetical protein
MRKFIFPGLGDEMYLGPAPKMSDEELSQYTCDINYAKLHLDEDIRNKLLAKYKAHLAKLSDEEVAKILANIEAKEK